MGDLNYRLVTTNAVGGGLTDADVRAAIRAGALEPLLAADQLLRERAAGRVFQGWQEGGITFMPTYKFIPGTIAYSGAGGGANGDAEGHKRRTPAWCDRVLWWERDAPQADEGAAPGARLQQLAYWRGELDVSDHKPVCALFRAVVPSYDRPRIEALLEASTLAVAQTQGPAPPQ